MMISIHALLAESDRITQGDNFQQGHFYPRSPCGERLLGRVVAALRMSFLSTLSLRRATCITTITICTVSFLSTLSLRRATAVIRRAVCAYYISIHALLAESDFACTGWFQIVYYFYPRSPCGERRVKPIFREINTRDFYPRSPCGERR